MIVQLYIQGERVDMFEEESISISDSIQNVRDIGKIFTSFSRTFSVPASKVNNKIFKHYYNSDIDNGFDARFKVGSTIEVNNMPFKTGLVKLEGVDLKNNIPFKYRITFFGDVVDLKDKLGEKKLSDLNLTQYDLDYDAATVETKLITPKSSTNHIIAPLITHSQELYYDSNPNNEQPDDGNLYFHGGNGNHIHGLKWNELKYAIRVNKIIEAIEDTFDLEFSSDFFKNTNLTRFNDLFLWLHRKSGKVENLTGTTEIETRVNEWVYTEDLPYEISQGYFDIYEDAQYITSLNLFLDPVNDSTEYDIRIDFNGEEVFSSTNNTGNTTITGGTDFDISGNGYYEVYITTDAAMDFTNVRWNSTYVEGSETESINYSTGAFTTSGTFVFQIAKQMPDIKVLEFLTGLFKTFNLTAYVVDNVIQVKPLNDFYDSGKGATSSTSGWDITEYVDVTESSVDATGIYKEVVFEFKDTKTILANKYGEIQNKPWGQISYDLGRDDLSSNSTYKIEVPFSKMMYETLRPDVSPETKEIQWGYSVDKSQNAYKGSPLLFYPIVINVYDETTQSGISFVWDVDENNVGTEHKNVNYVNSPFNSPNFSSSNNPFQLSFYKETGEFSLDTTYNETLFTEYYEDYIEGVFNKKNRLTKVSAYLPLNIILNYSLADRFIIKDKSYKINSIDTDFKTGKSEIELIGDF